MKGKGKGGAGGAGGAVVEGWGVGVALTCGAASTSGNHVRESSGFYPATHPLIPQFVTHTHTHSHNPVTPVNSYCQMAAHCASHAPTSSL